VAKLVMRISYTLCVICVLLALIIRILAVFGSTTTLFSSRALPIGYHSFVDGVWIFSLLTLSSASVEFINRRFQ
jgi:hypothetical protein